MEARALANAKAQIAEDKAKDEEQSTDAFSRGKGRGAGRPCKAHEAPK